MEPRRSRPKSGQSPQAGAARNRRLTQSAQASRSSEQTVSGTPPSRPRKEGWTFVWEEDRLRLMIVGVGVVIFVILFVLDPLHLR